MGLYDTVKIEFNVSDWIPNCPISDEELKSIEYQTKDFDCLMDTYLIDVAGHLWHTGSDFLSDKSNIKIASTGTTYKLHDGSVLTMPFNGNMNLYSFTEEYKLIEFIASIHHATLESLHLLTLNKREPNG